MNTSNYLRLSARVWKNNEQLYISFTETTCTSEVNTDFDLHIQNSLRELPVC